MYNRRLGNSKKEGTMGQAQDTLRELLSKHGRLLEVICEANKRKPYERYLSGLNSRAIAMTAV